MHGYSTEPLKDPVFDNAEVILEYVAFNNWLYANYTNLDNESMQGPREHLYYLLSSYVSELNRRDGIILPKESDPVLETLFSWSERLGVYGAHLFYNKVRKTDAEAMPALMEISQGIEISAVDDMYVVRSKNGSWSMRFPYYFMIGAINEFTATNGMDTQLITISTGAAKDKTQAGYSQSTLMFIHAQSDSEDEFKDYWLNRFEIDSNTKPELLGINKLKSFYAYNRQLQLHKNIAFIPSSEGSYLVAYLGNDGAYQKNKLHFLDFLSQLSFNQISVAKDLVD